MNFDIKHDLPIILKKYAGEGFYLADDIPAAKLHNARTVYFTDPDDQAVALLDNTLFGSAKNGLVFRLKGLYWQNSFIASAKTTKNFLSWEEINDSNPKIAEKDEIHFGSGAILYLFNNTLKPEAFMEILAEVKKNLRVSLKE